MLLTANTTQKIVGNGEWMLVASSGEIWVQSFGVFDMFIHNTAHLDGLSADAKEVFFRPKYVGYGLFQHAMQVSQGQFIFIRADVAVELTICATDPVQ